jgi:hypothetical protein
VNRQLTAVQRFTPTARLVWRTLRLAWPDLRAQDEPTDDFKNSQPRTLPPVSLNTRRFDSTGAITEWDEGNLGFTTRSRLLTGIADGLRLL